MMGEIFLWSVSKIIDLKSWIKSALNGKDAFDIFSWSCLTFILSSFCFSFDKFVLLILGILKKFVKLGAFVFAGLIFYFIFESFGFWWIRYFFQMFLSFLQLSFGLSIKSTHEIEWSKMTCWNGTEEFWKKSKLLVLNHKWFFCLLTFNSRTDIITRYNFNQVRCFFTFNRFHDLIGCISKIRE